MRNTLQIVAVITLLVAVAAPCDAETVEVTVRGFVDFNYITDPPLSNVSEGELVVLTFEVDSDVFVDSTTFPNRGYAIDPTSFVFTLGTTVMGLQDPFPAGQTPYFVLRNDDQVFDDGFLISTDIDAPIGVPINQPGVFEQLVNNHSRIYTDDTLSSLDILDALGDYTNAGALPGNWWSVDDASYIALDIDFSSMTISDLPIFADDFESGDTSTWSSTVP